MSHFDNLVTTIADSLIRAAYSERDSCPGDYLDTGVVSYVECEGVLNLINVAQAIVAAGWVHADDLQDGAA